MGAEVSDLESGRWTVDPVHSEITFTVRHLMTTVRGSFTDFGGEVEIGDDPLDSRAHAEIRMDSIDTRSEDRDAHVRSADFLDVDEHPVMTFVGHGVERAAIGRRARNPRYHVHGELTIKDVTRPVQATGTYAAPTADAFGNTRGPLQLEAVVDRGEFGMDWNMDLPTGGKVLANDVTLTVDLSLVQA